MKSEEIVGLFERLAENIPVIAQQPTEEDVYDLYEAVYPVLLDIEYDATEGKHNLVGLVDTDADYTAQYNESFPIPTRVGVYDESLLELKGDGADAKRAGGASKGTLGTDGGVAAIGGGEGRLGLRGTQQSTTFGVSGRGTPRRGSWGGARARGAPPAPRWALHWWNAPRNFSSASSCASVLGAAGGESVSSPASFSMP